MTNVIDCTKIEIQKISTVKERKIDWM